MDIRSRESGLRELMIAGLDGDGTAHRTLLERLSSQLRAYFKGQLNRIGRGAVEAEDLVQEVLIAIHIRRHTYDRSQPFTPWMYAIARYKFLDYLRRMRASAANVPIDDVGEIAAHDDNIQVESSLDLDKLLAAAESGRR